MMPNLEVWLTIPEWQSLLGGLWLSVQIAALTLGVGVPLGAVLGLLLMRRSRLVSGAAILVVEVLRGVPALILLSLVYYGLPSRSIVLPSMAAAVAALGLSTAGYTSEIFRTAFRAVPRGQREASKSLGLRPGTEFFYVILPQALRTATPQLVSFSVLALQATALCFAIAIPELLSQAYQIGTFTFEYLRALSAAAALYAVVALPLMYLATRLERRASSRL